ncbi:UNVERIFIED_CONTAM: hypothetical protein HDU68_012744 [Siphonaria sp. JEL0065]|nr:hypothetical protein HDU68_012744 [Siphonaria sp. JEL0065]
MRGDDDRPRYNPAQLESEIPDELKETPPLETVGMLDKRFDDLVTEIGFMHESRGKDFQNLDARKDRLPAVQTISYFEQYRKVRQKRIDAVSKVELPVRPETNGAKVLNEIESYWDVSQEINGDKLLLILHEFFLNKSFQTLQESSLLLSRWQRFCKTSYDVSNYSSLFLEHFALLNTEFTDSVHRFERITESVEERDKILKQIQAAEDAIRFEAEKTGLVGQKKVDRKQVANVSSLATEALKIRKATEKEAKEQADLEAKKCLERHRRCDDESEAPPDLFDPGFDVSDLAIYMRSMITRSKGVREMETFRRRAKTMLLVDRVPMLRDYRLLSGLSPGSNLIDIVDDYDGVNLFMDSPPVKTPKVEDFLTEFEILCAHYNIETSMVQEDGRPFSFEVDGRFTCKFFEQVLETNFTQDGEHEKPASHANNSGGGNNTTAPAEKPSGISMDTKTGSVANAMFILTLSGIQLPTTSQIRRSDWLSEAVLNPQFEDYQERQADTLKQQKDVDFELMCEIDLMRCNDMDIVLHRLKENARKTWELGSRKPNSKPLMAKSSVLSKPGTRAIQEPEKLNFQQRTPESFDLGMMVPDGRDHLSDFHVLDGKKQNYGQILKTNEDLVEASQENGGDASKKAIPGVIEPTIATVFAEHEINSYMMLRLCRIRELRNTLRGQLNFFRSIEKRVNIDLRASRLRSKLDILEHFKPTYENLASILRNQASTFDTEDDSGNQVGDAGMTFASPKLADPCPEDFRSIKMGNVEIQDHKGISIVYDSAIQDLQDLENEMLKMATIFINNGLNGRVAAGAGFFDDLLLKRDKNKSDIKDITYINPLVDRAQLLMELFDSEVKYQNAKIEAVNVYMEVFEHTRGYDEIKKLSQIIINLVYARPDIDFAASYFSRDYAFATKSMRIQATLMTSIIQRTIESHREWVDRHILKVTVPKEEPESKGPTVIVEDTSSYRESVVKYIEKVKSLKEKLDVTGSTGSSIKIGLPWKIASDKKFIMHSPAVSVNLNEVVPALSAVIKIHKEASMYCRQFYTLLQTILGKDGIVATPSRGAAACVVWKGLNKLWRDFCEQDFILPLKGRRLVGGLDNDDWLENPLLPDLILADKYSPLDIQLTGKNKGFIPNMLAPYTIFTDFWKFTYEEQFPQMGLEKSEYTGRLGAVNYDLPGMDNTVIEDDDFEDLDGKEISYEAGGEGTESTNIIHWRCGPLAIAELDDSHPLFDFSSFKSIMQLLRPLNISTMTRSLKAQILEKNWLMASAEINGHILHEIHKGAMYEKESDLKLMDKNKKKKPGRVNAKDKNTKQFDVDYKNFIATNILTKKKQMRKAMLIEYAKELSCSDLKEKDRDEEIIVLKYNLTEWYLSNMKEIAVEECERAEYATLMLEFRVYAQSLPAGRVVFRNSKITKNKEFVTSGAGTDKGRDGLKPLDLERSIEVQEVVTRAIEGSEKMTTLCLVDRQSELYNKSIKLQKLVIEIMRCVSIYASLYCDNSRFVKSVRDLREAEYVTNVMTSMKKDLSHQGAQLDFDAAERYLSSKWELWFMKTRLALLSVGYATAMRILPKSTALLSLQEEIMCQKKSTDKVNNPKTFWDFSKVKTRTTYPTFIRLASRYSFSRLEPAAKECAETKIGELEDTMEQYTQATMLNFGESNDELSKSQMDYLLTRIRLFLLRKEYINLTLFGSPITKEEQVAEVMRLYKMRVIVGALRLYHKQGARGNAATSILLSDEIVKSTNEMELNRMSMAAFEKCQITTLLGELARQYTTNLLRNAKQYFNQLVDERTGKLFKAYEQIEVQPASGERQFAFRVTDSNYNTKMLILQGFIDDLYRSNTIYLKEKKKEGGNVAAQVLAGKPPPKGEEDERQFCCTRDQLAKAVQKMALQFTKWGEQHIVEQEHMMQGAISKLQESLRNSDKIIANLIQDKKDLQESFYHNVRLATANAVADIYAELASKSVEINDLRKSRRIDEKKIRSKVIDEYDDLVSELVMENHVMRNRFNEYRTNTVQEMVGIIAETKREELVQLTESAEIPDQLKTSAQRTIEHDEAIKELNDELHEVNMTMKVLTEESKKAEEKLWDSYRNAEAREQTLRKIISKNSKDLLMAETRNDTLQRQLKEEQTKLRQIASKTDRTVSAARTRADHSTSHEARMTDAVEKLKYYEKINVERLLVELKEKTEIIEDMLQKKRNEAKIALQTQAAMIVNHTNKLDANRPSTAAPAFNKNKRTPVDDLLFRLAASTEENNELKRKLSILSVTAGAKRLLNNSVPLPSKVEVEKEKTITVERACQTEKRQKSFVNTEDFEANEKLEPVVSPYADADIFTMNNYDDIQFDDVDDEEDDNFLARRRSVEVSAKATKEKVVNVSVTKRASISANIRSSAGISRRTSVPANALNLEGIRVGATSASRRTSVKTNDAPPKRPNQYSPNGRISIPTQGTVLEQNAEYTQDSESPRKSKRASTTNPANRFVPPPQGNLSQLKSLNVGGHSIAPNPTTLPSVTAPKQTEAGKKSVWDEIYDYSGK